LAPRRKRILPPTFASLIETCKINGVEPFAYLKATLTAIANGHPQKAASTTSCPGTSSRHVEPTVLSCQRLHLARVWPQLVVPAMARQMNTYLNC
jgi:hypothetical protein